MFKEILVGFMGFPWDFRSVPVIFQKMRVSGAFQEYSESIRKSHGRSRSFQGVLRAVQWVSGALQRVLGILDEFQGAPGAFYGVSEDFF